MPTGSFPMTHAAILSCSLQLPTSARPLTLGQGDLK